MTPRAYYNDNDPEAVAVLSELIASGIIAPGDVDARSIKDVTADDIAGYSQCHFFAGAGLWSIGARIAGWSDSRPLWTASCPCQPISGAGEQRGSDDPRHLWPDLYRLIGAAKRAGQRIPVFVGEQVAGAAGYNWFDGVRIDLAREDIAARTIDIPACAVDAPHQRHRLWWCAVANTDRERTGARRPALPPGRDAIEGNHGGLADADLDRQRQPQGRIAKQRRWRVHRHATGAMGVANGARLEGLGRDVADGAERPQPGRPVTAPDGRNRSFWSDAKWITCHDGKARRAKPGIPMLVDGMAGRIAVWRLAGNSIVPQLAAEVLAAILEAEAELT